MKLTRIVFCLTMLVLLTASCVREDLDDCRSTNVLLLSYKGDGNTEIFPKKINRVELFVFDAENQYVNSRLLSADEVAARRTTLPALAEGTYRIVCLGNTHATKTEGLTSGDYYSMLFASNDYFNNATTLKGNDSLYYASTYYKVLPFGANGETDREQVIEFASSHYDFWVEVVGMPVAASGKASSYSLELSGVTPCTDFENKVTGAPVNYLLESNYNSHSGTMTAFANIMRHTNHRNVNLHLRHSADEKPIATVNLAAFLAAHPAIDCSKNEVLIPIRIEFIEGNVTIKVPDWFVEHVKPEF